MKQLNKEIKKIIIQGLIPIIMSLIFDIFFCILMNCRFVYVFFVLAGGLLFKILIFYILYGILISITKKLSTSTIILSVLEIILLLINQVKFVYTGDVILFSDINFFSNINGILSLITLNDLLVLVKVYLLRIIILIIVFGLIIKWTKKNDVIFNNLKLRLIAITICTLILVFLFVPNKSTNKLFLSIFLNEEEKQSTTVLEYCIENSLITGMYGILLNDRFTEPEGYNEKVIDNVLDKYNQNSEEGTYGTPNIILVFSESFWDIDKQNDVEFNQEVAPNIKRLKEEGKLIESLSCAYGRLSENIAFELLTGGSLNYFSNGYIPIMSLYKRNNSENNPSIVKELKRNGYKTKIVFGEDYYNSKKTMEKIGFDEYIDVETEESKENRNNISDEYLTDLIIEELENKKENEKIFYMTETIQNHMPYTIEKYGKYNVSIKNSKLNEHDNEAILSYAQGVNDADKQLNRLYEYIKQYKEPTILIFLGDHLPYLYTENIDNNAVNRMSYFNTVNEIENIYRKYNTQTLILSNYEINTDNMPTYMSNNLILTYIVNNMDIELSSYYKWLYSTMEELPATNSYISIDIYGNKYRTQELTGTMKMINKLREYVQYKLFVKSTE